MRRQSKPRARPGSAAADPAPGDATGSPRARAASARLDRVRREGDWEAWLAFYLEGVRLTADGAVSTDKGLADMFRVDRSRIELSGRRPDRPCACTRR